MRKERGDSTSRKHSLSLLSVLLIISFYYFITLLFLNILNPYVFIQYKKIEPKAPNASNYFKNKGKIYYKINE